MSLNDQLAGRSFGPVGVSWSHKDAILYALGIGAGGQDALGDLELTTENSLEVSPVTPGDTLRVDVWRASAGDAVFRTSGAAGTVVIDRGWIRLAEAGAVRPR
jgi:hypothetical protein